MSREVVRVGDVWRWEEEPDFTVEKVLKSRAVLDDGKVVPIDVPVGVLPLPRSNGR